MANNLIQVKRTSVSGRAANSTTLPNPGELALNMTDGILYSTNGSAVFEVGANNTNSRVTGTLTVNAISANGSVGSNNQRLTSNGSSTHWKDPLLKDLVDVDANGATDSQILTYSSSLQKWINKNPPIANVVYSTGYYGVFYDTSDRQWATGGSNSATVLSLNTSYLTNGITRNANNEMVVGYSGVYQISYSIQYTSSSNKNESIWVWIRKNGTDISDSATNFGVYPVSGSSNGYLVAVTPITESLNANDKLQIMWATSSNSAVSLITEANTAFAPQTPGAIVSIIPISNIITAPPGNNTDVIFNDSGLANAVAGFTFNKTTNSVSIANDLFVGNTVNASAFTIGDKFLANSTVVNSASFQVDGEFSANSTLVNAASIMVRGDATVNGTIILNSINAAGSLGLAGQVLGVNSTGGIIWNDIDTVNIIYVSKDGSDSNDGSLTRPYLTLKKALSVASSGTTIRVSSGTYTENNPLTIPTNVSVIGDSLRNVTIIPQNTSQDVFWLNNGSYVTELTIKDYVSPAAAFAFPDTGAGTITRSPYILNCTSLTTDGIGLLVDGAKSGGNRSIIAGLYTIINQNGIGVKITNRGYSQLVNIYTICANIGVLAEKGGFCTLNCSDNSFGNYGLIADGTSNTLYTGVTSGANQFGTQFTIGGLSQTPFINNVLKFEGDSNYYTIIGATPLSSNSSTVTIMERVSIPVANNTAVNFYQRSYIAAAGHAFEYVGTGTNIANASPFAGGIVVSNNRAVSLNGGVVNFTSTDQFGNFNINNNLTINGINATIEGDAFQRSLFGLMTPYILAIEGSP